MTFSVHISCGYTMSVRVLVQFCEIKDGGQCDLVNNVYS